jgi:hypothetical protein
MITAALFTTAKPWNQPTVPNNPWMDKENVVPLHNGVLLSHKERNYATCRTMELKIMLSEIRL